MRMQLFPRLKALLLIGLSAVTTAFCGSSYAQTLNLQNNQFTVSVPSTSFSQTVTVANDGSVAAVSGVPTTGTLTTPTFSFTLQGTAINSTMGTYSVGIVLDETSSMRRLEVFIPTVTLTFDGSGNLTGNLGAQNVKIYGRDASGATVAETSVASAGSVSFNGNSISFSAADQIALIQAQGGILADITTSINNTGLSYNYTVILANTANTNYDFRHTDTMSFPPASGEFVVGTGDNTVLNSMSQKLFGTVTFGAGGGGGGGGGSEEDEPLTNAEINQEINNLGDLSDPANVNDEKIASVANLVSDSATNADTLASQLALGDATPSEGLAVVETISNVLSTSGDLNQNPSGATQSTDSLVSILNSVGGLFNTIDSAGALNAGEIASMEATTIALSANLAKNIASALPENESQSIANALGNVLASNLKVGGSLTPDLVANVQSVANNLTQAARDSLCGRFPQLPTCPSGDPSLEVRFQVRYLETFCDSNQRIPIIEALSGLVGAAADRFSVAQCASSLMGLENIGGSLSRIFNNEASVESQIAAAIGEGASVVDVPEDERTDITFEGALFPTSVIDTFIASDSFSDGTTLLNTGAALIITDGLGFIAAPSAKDFSAFSTGISDSFGATVTRNNENGSFLLENSELKASVTFAFEDASAATGPTGSVSFSGGEGNPASAEFKFTVHYSDGTSQSMLPFVADPNFIDSLQLLGTLPTIDRSTGVVNIEGLLVKPDLTVRELTVAEQTFLDNNNGDANGVVLDTAGDVNGDGIDDYEIFSAVGYQVLYGVAQ